MHHVYDGAAVGMCYAGEFCCLEMGGGGGHGGQFSGKLYFVLLDLLEVLLEGGGIAVGNKILMMSGWLIVWVRFVLDIAKMCFGGGGYGADVVEDAIDVFAIETKDLPKWGEVGEAVAVYDDVVTASEVGESVEGEAGAVVELDAEVEEDDGDGESKDNGGAEGVEQPGGGGEAVMSGHERAKTSRESIGYVGDFGEFVFLQGSW